jgi:GNAT superfamily N-acetyltransferase
MTESPAPAKDQLQEDVALTWSYAANAGLRPNLDAASGSAARQRAQQVSIARWDRYAMELLHDLDCDPGRLEVVAEACRARCGPPAGTGVPRPGYHEAARLADLALERLRQAEAEDPHGGTTRLMAELVRERTGDSEPYRQGLWHRHSWPRQLLRRVSPVWWYRRLGARFAVTMTCKPYDNPRLDELTMHVGRDRKYDIGHVVFHVCHECKAGFVAKMSVDETYQGLGIGSRALAYLRAQVPGYRWSTSSQYITARTFWQRTARLAGGGYEASGPCEHIDL